jgi:hypothetical protein
MYDAYAAGEMAVRLRQFVSLGSLRKLNGLGVAYAGRLAYDFAGSASILSASLGLHHASKATAEGV